MIEYFEAISSALLFNLSLVVQAMDARRAPRQLGMRPGLLFHLMRRWKWMLGNAMNVAAAVLQVWALERLPIAVVQSIAAGGILLVPLSARWLVRERLRSLDLAAIAVITAGLALAMASTPPQTAQLAFSVWPLFGVIFGLCALGAVAARKLGGMSTVLVAGVAMGAATIVMKILALPETSGLRVAVAVALVVASGGTGFLAQTTALQTSSPARVAPLVLAASTAIPILTAPWLFAERWPHPPITLLATLLVLVASAWLARVPVMPPPAPEAA